MKSIERIKASNILSFGPDGIDVELGDLNVLIGPNGSGKSNFLELFALLRSFAMSIVSSKGTSEIISKGGGIAEWMHKKSADSTAEIFIETPGYEGFSIAHKIQFKNFDNSFKVVDEVIEHPMMMKYERERTDASFSSLLSMPKKYVKLGVVIAETVVEVYEKITLYREWPFGRNSIFRLPQPADLRSDRLEEDYSNLALFLSKLAKTPQSKKRLIKALGKLYDGLDSYEVVIEGNTAQVFFTEGDFTIPARRLSDGSLRYLCLLAILLDPTPPPLICLEEPELGMHPDLLPTIAELLVDASERTQLIVTTHSDILIDALTDRPECILVCEKHDGQTTIKRLKKAEIEPWLKKYGLGQLWIDGEIGGKR